MSGGVFSNVVIHDDYVAKNLETIYLGESNIKKGLPYFYTDVNSSVVILASTNPNGFVPLDLNPNHVTRYRIARDVPKLIHSKEEFIKKSGRINAIIESRKLNGVDYIPNYSLPNGFTIGIVGDDFYIYCDKDLNLVADNIDVDDRSYQELEEARMYLETYINTINESKISK